MELINKIEIHINHFRLRAHRKARAHYLASKIMARRHFILGIPVIFITSLIGSSIFVEYSKNSDYITPGLLGGISLLAVILSAFQTFFGYSSQSAKHKNAADQYNSLYRRMTLVGTKYLSGEYSNQLILSEIEIIQNDWESIEFKALDVSDKLYDKAKKEQLLDDEDV